MRPDKGTLPGDDAFRFRHILIRDAAYEALPKATRARLHERFADWLEQRTPDLVELDEIVGYHLEQATRYRLELGALSEPERAVAARGAERLLVAGERALARRDVRASSSLLGRGLALLPPGTRAVEREWKLVLALMESGELATALERADDLAARAEEAGDRRAELYGRLAASFVAFQTTPEEMPMAALSELATGARSEFQAAGDELGVGLCWFALAHVHHNACSWQERHDALELAHLHGVRAHDDYLQEHSLLWMAAGPVYGPMPTDEGLRWFALHEEQLEGVAIVMSMRASVEAMIGNFDEARELVRKATARLGELGQGLWLGAVGMHSMTIETLAGNHDEAAREGIATCEALEALGERGWLSTVAGQTARELLAVDRRDEAERWIGVAEETGGESDVITQALIRQVRATLLSRRGLHAEAEKLARDAVALLEPTDMLEGIADARLDLAEVLHAAGKTTERLQTLEEAAVFYERKRHLVGLARTRALLESAHSRA